jgi:hypothetical protein
VALHGRSSSGPLHDGTPTPLLQYQNIGRWESTLESNAHWASSLGRDWASLAPVGLLIPADTKTDRPATVLRSGTRTKHARCCSASKIRVRCALIPPARLGATALHVCVLRRQRAHTGAGRGMHAGGGGAGAGVARGGV